MNKTEERKKMLRDLVNPKPVLIEKLDKIIELLEKIGRSE